MSTIMLFRRQLSALACCLVLFFPFTAGALDYPPEGTPMSGSLSPREDFSSFEEEARFVYDMCRTNPYLKRVQKCSCVADTVLETRARGSKLSNGELFRQITESNQKCVNLSAIGEDAVKSCQIFVRMNSISDPTKFCGCVSEQVQKAYLKKYIFSPSYTTALLTSAYSTCRSTSSRRN